MTLAKALAWKAGGRSAMLRCVGMEERRANMHRSGVTQLTRTCDSEIPVCVWGIANDM